MTALMAIIALSFAFSPVTASASPFVIGHDDAQGVTGLPSNLPAAVVHEVSPNSHPVVSAVIPPTQAPVVSNPPVPSDVPAAKAPAKKKRSSGGHSYIVKKKVANTGAVVATAPVSAPVLSKIEVTPPSAIVAVNTTKPVAAVAPTKPTTQVEVATVSATPVVAANTANATEVNTNLGASASQSFGSKFVGFFSNLWNCVFGSVCK